MIMDESTGPKFTKEYGYLHTYWQSESEGQFEDQNEKLKKEELT